MLPVPQTRATGQGIAVMHGSAKVVADPIMPAWPTCLDLPTNATPDKIQDSESSSEGYEDLVQVLRDNDACEFDDSSKFEEICVRICTSGGASVHLLSF